MNGDLGDRWSHLLGLLVVTFQWQLKLRFTFLRKVFLKNISISPISVYFIHLNSEGQLISNWSERQVAQLLAALLYLENVLKSKIRRKLYTSLSSFAALFNRLGLPSSQSF